LYEQFAMGVTTTSAHLQVLRRAGLVETRKDGTKVHYRIGGNDVVALVVALRDLARVRLAELESLAAHPARPTREPSRSTVTLFSPASPASVIQAITWAELKAIRP
jgi:hypothetical protein